MRTRTGDPVSAYYYRNNSELSRYVNFSASVDFDAYKQSSQNVQNSKYIALNASGALAGTVPTILPMKAEGCV